MTISLAAAIVDDARHPTKYRMLLSMVDVIFADIAQPDQARIVAINAEHFLKNGGHAVISIKANCIDSTVPAEQVFAHEVQELRDHKFKPLEQITLEPYERVSVSSSLRMVEAHDFAGRTMRSCVLCISDMSR